MSPTQRKLTRRRFIADAGCAALGTTTLFSSLINLKAMASAVMDKRQSSSDDYRALVCILLSGGADSYNMLIPKGNAEYQEYQVTRANLAIPQSEILTLNHSGQQGRKYGLHPGMPELQNLFNTGKTAFIANVGTLIAPTTKAQWESGAHPLPLGLFSHSDQVMQWQTGRPGERSGHGWAGRIADLVSSQNSNQLMSMNVSLNGSNQFQSGAQSFEFTIKPSGNVGVYGYDQDNAFYSLRNTAITSMLERDYQDLFEQTYVNTLKNSVEGSVDFREAVEALPEFTTVFSEHQLSQRMKMVAKVIAVRQQLGFSRQTFFINFSGWDHHDNGLENQASKVPVLSKALSEFYAATEELGVANEVLTFTISDFARTLTSNGDGTDHAWGGHAMVMGGAVQGGTIYGEYPSLEIDSDLMINRGRYIPGISSAEYIAELALWFGVSPGDVIDILPDLPNFFDAYSGSMPIGFTSSGA